MPGVAEGDLILWPARQAVNEPAAAPVAGHVPREPARDCGRRGPSYSVLKTLYRCKKSLKPSLKRPVAPTCSVGSTCEKNENSV